jgi:hypothetical protein
MALYISSRGENIDEQTDTTVSDSIVAKSDSLITKKCTCLKYITKAYRGAE